MPLATNPASESPAVRAALLQFRCQQGVRVPYVVLVLTGLIVKLIWEYEPVPLLAAWAAAVCGVLFFRSQMFNRYAERPPAVEDVDRIGRIMNVLTLLAGVIGGSAGWLFFPDVPLVEQALLTMMMVCWSAIAVGSTSATPKLFLVFALPLLGPLGCNWLWSDMPQGPYIGALIFFFLVIQHLIARDNGRQLQRSITIRLENLALIDALQKEREEANVARETAEAANRAKSRFLAAASHDLRQPMHALSLYSAALSGTVTQPRVQKIANNIGVCVDSLDNLFEALLDISKLDAGLIVPQIRQIEVQALLNRLRTEFAPRAQAQGLSLVVGRHAGHINSDPVMLERIIRNLLDNAVRYTREGSITLAARDLPGGLEISVADTGIGVAPDQQERIFEEFHQVSAAPDARTPIGLGLGLATVRRMSELLGGSVSLESASGKGSVFRLTLVSDQKKLSGPALAQTDGASLAAVDLRERLVLVVEDDLRAQDAMRTLLKSWGCAYLVASTIEEAVVAVKKEPRAPDMVLADYRLGKGVSGIDAIEAITGLVGEVPAILITGATDLRKISEPRGAKYCLLHKPLKAALLRTEMLRLLSGNAAGGKQDAAPAPAPG